MLKLRTPAKFAWINTIRTGRDDLPVPKHFKGIGHTMRDLKLCIIVHLPKAKKGGDRSLALKLK